MRFEGPCTTCPEKTACSVYPGLREGLFDRADYQTGPPIDELDRGMDEVAAAWLDQVAGLVGTLDDADRAASLSAVFDLLCSALYARAALGFDGSVAGRVLRCGHHYVMPYTWMCPLCVAQGEARTTAYLPDARYEKKGSTRRLYPRVEYTSKPGSRFIGDVGIKVLKSVLRVMLARSNSPLRLAEGGGRRGEFDLTLSSSDLLLLCEVKAKPLISFPLVADAPDKASAHVWQDEEFKTDGPFRMFIAAADMSIDLGVVDSETWPLPELAAAANDPASVAAVIKGWRRHLDAYRAWVDEPDALRWHRYGCGNFSAQVGGQRVEHRVANTKELPGLDRTDDIKKGAAQVLLFNKYKALCSKNAVKSGLLGNLYAETHGADYLDELAKMQVRAGDDAPWCWVFDLVLGLSRNVFRDDRIEASLSTTVVLGR